MVIVGMFETSGDAETAIRDLKASGFSHERIGIAMHEQSVVMKPPPVAVPAGADEGETRGGILGGTIGLFGSLLMPGIGSVVVGGLLASALTRPGLGAGTCRLSDALVRMGVPGPDTKHFESGLSGGKVLIIVHAFTRTDEVLDIFRRRRADFGPSGTARYTPGAALGYVGVERRQYSNVSYAGTERRMTTIWV